MLVGVKIVPGREKTVEILLLCLKSFIEPENLRLKSILEDFLFTEI